MVTVKRPERIFSFSDHSRQQPNRPPPGDRLDAQFIELTEAIRTTQDALAEIRRDDGKLKPHATLEPSTMQELVDTFASRIAPAALKIAGTAQEAKAAEQQAMLYARDAEAALQVATQLIAGMKALRQLITQKSDVSATNNEISAMLTTEAENWANYSHAQADNAAKARDEATMWAEYLAGPVVNPADAPAYIAGSPFGSGLYYQPVEGGLAGLWSAKWWALQAYSLVGAAGQFFLGPWPANPLPGEQNPQTGQVAPNPIPPGSIYYDTTSGQIMVWNGTEWKTSVALTSSVQTTYVYQAAANQQNFVGADLNGQTPDVGNYPSDIHVNGVRLAPTLDYTIDVGTDTLHINAPLTAGSIVQWDLLTPPAPSRSALNAWKIKPLVPDGTIQNFPLEYVDGGSVTQPANVGKSEELIVILDGTPQEPGIDFTASGSALHLISVPGADSDLWAVWYQPATP